MADPTTTADYVLGQLESWLEQGSVPTPEELGRLAVWASVARSELRSLASERRAAQEILLEARDVIGAVAPGVGVRALRLIAEHTELAALLDKLLRGNLFNAETGKAAPVEGSPARNVGSPEKALRELVAELERHSPYVPTREKPLPPNVTKFRRR